MSRDRLLHLFFHPRAQVGLAWALLGGSLVGWPLSALTVAAGEPKFILGLSWLALILTAHNTLLTARKDADRDKPPL